MPKRIPTKATATRGAELLHTWLYRSIPTHKDGYGRRRLMEVALDLNVDPSSLRHWARGDTMPSSRNIRALAAYCMIPPAAWFEPVSSSEV
jgi:hypothetical protein